MAGAVLDLRDADVVLQLLSCPTSLLSLVLQLFVQQPNLRLSLFLRSLHPRNFFFVFDFLLLFLAAQEFQITTEGLSVFLDPSEIGLKASHSFGYAAFLCRNPLLLSFYFL